ncbi:MAG: hypothetical protein ACYC0I_09440 [Acidimicrobiales bacterium]
MGVLKAFFKLALLLLVGAAIAGVVMMVKRPTPQSPLSFEHWPDVPQNPAA